MALRGFNFLKTGRQIRGLTQIEVAEIYGVSQRTYQRWERGDVADIVRERAVVRDMIGVAHEIADAGYNPEGRNSGDLLDLAETKVFKIAESRANANEGPEGIKSITVDKIYYATDRVLALLLYVKQGCKLTKRVLPNKTMPSGIVLF
ncbi:hypothetical protein BCU84_11870 [Shewanella sp. 10N.286.51.B7]|nr:hypothetical protein BCU84_11870 [Shewanella sp. 10N.286.51.B7]